MLSHWSWSWADIYYLPPRPPIILGLHPLGTCVNLWSWGSCLRTNCSNPPNGTHADVLSYLVSVSTQSSWMVWIFPFPHCSVILVNGHESPCGRINGITTVYTCCSFIGSFFKGTWHPLQLMGSRWRNWVRDCDFHHSGDLNFSLACISFPLLRNKSPQI